MTLQEHLASHGIILKSYAPGRHYTTCPQCSHQRSSKAHQEAECLGVTVEADGSARWGCNHCEWTGAAKENSDDAPQQLTSYVYRDASGTPRFRKVRNRPGCEPRFWLEKFKHGKWSKGTKDVDTAILYRVDEVAKAIAVGVTILVAEGEKDVDTLCSLGFAATCNAHGASESSRKPKWTEKHGEQLRGAKIVVLNDNDAAGYAHAEAICGLSLGIAKHVYRLDLARHWPDMPKGADVSDWLALGHTAAELAALIESAPDYVAFKTPESAADTASKQDSNGKSEDAAARSEAENIRDEAEIARLAALRPLQYARERKTAAERLGIPASLLDQLVRAERAKKPADDNLQGGAIFFEEPELWPEAVGGAALLDEITAAIRRHVVLSEHACNTCALWIVHTYLLDQLFISPRLCVASPTKGCGKTLLLDIIACLVLRPLPTANVTPSALFRVIEGHRPTLLVDEADTFLATADELRGVLNSGHRRGGAVLRTVGDDHEPRSFRTYSACAIALIGKLPDTLHDRSVVVDLKRRLPTEQVKQFRLDRVEGFAVLARKVARFAAEKSALVGEADPKMPDGVINRMADNWRGLFAIADLAGGTWPERARQAVTAGQGEVQDASRLELLLGDIRDIFRASEHLDRIASAFLVERLIAIDGRPWADLGRNDKPLTQNQLARLLKPLGIGPEQIRLTADDTRKGYLQHRFKDAFERFLPPEGVIEPKQRNNADGTGTSDIFKPKQPDDDVSVGKCEKPNNDGLCFDVSVAEGVLRVCAHCGAPESPGNPVLECSVEGEIHLLHPACQRDWLELEEETPVGIVVVGPAPGATCVACHLADDGVMKIRPAVAGAKTETLHEQCAPGWFSNNERNLSS